MKSEEQNFQNKLTLRDSLILVMHCLQPSWREENMEDLDYWDEEPITQEEYFRVKTWWLNSGSLDKLILEFISSFATFLPEILSIGDNLMPTQDEWVSWFFEFFEWWPNNFDEFADRILEVAWIDNLDDGYFRSSLEDWWNSESSFKILEFIHDLTESLEVKARN